MKLITKEIENKIPKIYATEGTATDEKPIAVKFFDCWGSGRWYAIEGEKLANGDWKFFGYVTGLFEDELGYFLLSQLRDALGWRLERDIHFDNGITTLGQIKRGEKY